MFDYYKHTSMFWNDMIAMMSSKPSSLMAVGPLRNLTENVKKISQELIEANQEIVEFNTQLVEYYQHLGETWVGAQKKVMAKISEVPQDAESIEAYKRVWIDIFENDFTQMFDNKSFSKNYNKLVTTELQLLERWNTIMDVMLKSANMPTKEEINEIYKELFTLKKQIKKINTQKKTRREKNDSGI
jgi:predicted  nucleic acid-binding Zn-ribbon protein